MAKEIKFENKEIDGKNVKVIRQGLRKRIRAKAIVLQIAGPAIARGVLPLIASAQGKDSEDGSEETKAGLEGFDISKVDIGPILVPAIDGLAESLSEDKLLKLIDTLMVGVSVNDVDVADPDKFDFVFDDCMGTMYKVCAFSLKVNFGDLMSDLSTLIGLHQVEETEQTEPKESGNS